MISSRIIAVEVGLHIVVKDVAVDYDQSIASVAQKYPRTADCISLFPYEKWTEGRKGIRNIPEVHLYWPEYGEAMAVDQSRKNLQEAGLVPLVPA
jgi:hypothetical protein